MSCKTCDELLAVYKNTVSLLGDAVRKGSGATGDDSRLAIAEAARLGQQCKAASDALMEHWRQHHRNAAAKSDY